MKAWWTATPETVPESDKHPWGFLAGGLYILCSLLFFFEAKQTNLSYTDSDSQSEDGIINKQKTINIT